MLLDSWKRVRAAWDRFWFTPIPVLPLAIFRICLGLLALGFAWLIYEDLFVWFGADGIIPAPATQQWNGKISLNLLNIFPNSDQWLHVFFWIFVLAAFCLTIGFCTRISATIVFLALASFHHRNVLILNSGDSFMRLSCLWLIFSDAGKALSVDCFIKSGSSKADWAGIDALSNGWAQRMIQFQVCFVYAHAFYTKIFGELWQQGIAVYYSSRLEEFARFPLPYVFDNLVLIKLLTWGTLALEFSMFTLIWVKPLRYPIILMIICMHIVIDWTMNIPQFEWLMISSLILFAYPEDVVALFKAAARLKTGARPAAATETQ